MLLSIDYSPIFLAMVDGGSGSAAAGSPGPFTWTSAGPIPVLFRQPDTHCSARENLRQLVTLSCVTRWTVPAVFLNLSLLLSIIKTRRHGHKSQQLIG